MATDFDTFDRANSTSLGSTNGGKAWSQPFGTHEIDTNALYHNTNVDSMAIVNLATPYQATMATLGSTIDNCGVVARCNSTGTTCYFWFQYGFNCRCFEKVAGSFSELGPEGGAFSAGDTMEIRTQDTVITMMRNGSTFGPGVQSSSAISAGDYSGVYSGSVLGIRYGRIDFDYSAVAAGGRLYLPRRHQLTYR